MAVVLIVLGAVLVVLTFLLAFTIFGELSAVLGVACLVAGSLMLGRRTSRRISDRHRIDIPDPNSH